MGCRSCSNSGIAGGTDPIFACPQSSLPGQPPPLLVPNFFLLLNFSQLTIAGPIPLAFTKNRPFRTGKPITTTLTSPSCHLPSAFHCQSCRPPVVVTSPSRSPRWVGLLCAGGLSSVLRPDRVLQVGYQLSPSPSLLGLLCAGSQSRLRCRLAIVCDELVSNCPFTLSALGLRGAGSR
jgi:hypothetical protein